MSIRVTRVDPLAGVPDNTEGGILTQEQFANWDAALAGLRARGIPLTEQHEKEFRSHADTQFHWDEFIHAGTSAYSCRVQYDVREV